MEDIRVILTLSSGSLTPNQNTEKKLSAQMVRLDIRIGGWLKEALVTKMGSTPRLKHKSEAKALPGNERLPGQKEIHPFTTLKRKTNGYALG